MIINRAAILREVLDRTELGIIYVGLVYLQDTLKGDAKNGNETAERSAKDCERMMKLIEKAGH